jgi:hypothetical protein
MPAHFRASTPASGRKNTESTEPRFRALYISGLPEWRQLESGAKNRIPSFSPRVVIRCVWSNSLRHLTFSVAIQTCYGRTQERPLCNK